MPEANVLYAVTLAVVLGLVTWVLVVLRTAKQPWTRDGAPAVLSAEIDMTSPPGVVSDTRSGPDRDDAGA